MIVTSLLHSFFVYNYVNFVGFVDMNATPQPNAYQKQ